MKNIYGNVSEVPYWAVVDTIQENTETKNVEKLQHPALERRCVRYVTRSSSTVGHRGGFPAPLNVRGILPGNVEI